VFRLYFGTCLLIIVMKLILESWRGFRKKSLSEISGMGGASEEASLGALVSIADSKKAKSIFKKIYNTLNYYNTTANEAAHFIYIVGAGILDGVVDSSAQEKADFAVMVADPTGVTGHDFLKKQWKVAEDEVFEKGDLSYGTALMLVMAAMGALPVVSSLVKGGKLSMKVYNKALVKVSKAGPAGVKAVAKAKGAVDDVIKASSKDPVKTARSGTRRTADGDGRAQAAGRTMNIQRTSAMYLPNGQAYVIVKTADGPMPFYRSSGRGELTTKDWLPMFGVNERNELMKLGSRHRDAATFTARGRTSKGKYAVEGSEINNIGKALDTQGAFKGVSQMWKSPAEFLSNNITALSPGMNINQITAQLNRGLQKMGRPPLNPQTVENVAINLHLKVNGVNTNLTAMAGSGIPGVTSVIDQGTLIKALKLGR